MAAETVIHLMKNIQDIRLLGNLNSLCNNKIINF